MIKLVVTSNVGSTMTHSFNTSRITLGARSSTEADLPLPDDTLESIHVRLEKNLDGWVVINVANDPFATFNHIPFGRQPVNENDCIQIGELSIVVYPLESQELIPVAYKEKVLEPKKEVSSDELSLLFSQVEALAKKPPSSSVNLAESTTVVPIGEIEKPILDVIEGDNDEKVPLVDSRSEEIETPEPVTKRIPIPSLKDDYLSEYDDHDATPLHEITSDSSLSSDNVRRRQFFIKTVGTFLGVIAIFFGAVYLWISDRTGDEEVSAAQTISDVAMALTYAHVRNIHGQHHNWSDFEFIKSNFSSILAPEYPFLADFDRYGRLMNSPYTLRIYTDSTLSQFLVIAQPTPNLIHWLVPKPSIVIDSHSMEIRKVKDLKVLNRLLVNTNSLDGANAAEISAQVKQGTLISLAQLASKHAQNNFSPPKILSLLQPTASNFIYNAPRYYFLGQNLLKQAMEIMQSPTGHDIEIFMQELSKLNKYPDLVIYSDGGIQYAMKAQRALNILAPEDKFLFAYLQYDSKGNISTSHMLIDDPATEVAMNETPHGYLLEKSLYNTRLRGQGGESSTKRSISDVKHGGKDFIVDHGDPIHLHLTGLLDYRQKILKPISDAMIQLLMQESLAPQSDFSNQFLRLQTKYMEHIEEQQYEIDQHIGRVLISNPYLPAVQVIEYMKAAGLEDSFDKYLKSMNRDGASLENLHELIEIQLDLVEACTDWKSLNQIMTEVANILQFENVPDQNTLIVYQDAARSRVTKKLAQFLLSHDHALPKESYSKEDRQLLVHILDISWVIDWDAYDFYLDEFDQHAL